MIIVIMMFRMGQAIDKGTLIWHNLDLLKLTVVTRILVEKEEKILDSPWQTFCR